MDLGLGQSLYMDLSHQKRLRLCLIYLVLSERKEENNGPILSIHCITAFAEIQ